MPEIEKILDILADRYATQEMCAIFSPRNRVIAERNLWIAVLKAQRELGLDIPQEEIAKYEAAKDKVDFVRIKEIEEKRQHDVKARIEAFVEAAGAKELIHMGMTARDLTDNVEQMQINQAATLVFGKYVSILRHLLDKSRDYSGIVITARTHHQPAQPTLLGRRFAMWAEELYLHMPAFERFIDDYPLRGIKGPVGTQSDMLTLLGSREKVQALEKKVAELLGFKKVLDAPGQVYPRSLDYALTSRLVEVASAAQNFAVNMRLRAGYELVTEGFAEGQTGSTAMPHKMNTRSSERIWSLAEIVKGYNNMISSLVGSQWEEGDVSDSALRRVAIPGAFFASDGICETTLNVLNDMGAYPAVISKEVDRYLPFLATTQILMLALEHGLGREVAHEAIKRHATAVAREMREAGIDNDLVQRLAADSAFQSNGITAEKINDILAGGKRLLGAAFEQINDVTVKSAALLEKYSEQAKYEPQPIL